MVTSTDRPLCTGDRIVISHPEQGSCIGKIEDIRTPDETPQIEGFAPSGELNPQQIMREWGVTRVAVITYIQVPGKSLMFVALEIDGEWYDLQRQKLTIRRFGWTH